MRTLLISIGHGSVVSAHELVAIIQPQSAPVARLRAEARREGKLVDASQGQRTKAVLIMASGFIIESSEDVETLARRFNDAFLSEPSRPDI